MESSMFHNCNLLCTKCLNERRTFKIPSVSTAKLRKLHTMVVDKNHLLIFHNIQSLVMERRSETIFKSPFDSLIQTDISQLEMDAVAFGKYVFLRILQPVKQAFGFHTIVEDPKGNACWLCVLFRPLWAFMVGKVLIIKEPRFVYLSAGIYVIACECPTDIVFVNVSQPSYHLVQKIKWQNVIPPETIPDYPLLQEPIPTTFQEWKKRGLEMKQRKYNGEAREAFLKALQTCEQKDFGWKIVKIALADVNELLYLIEEAHSGLLDVLSAYPRDEMVLHKIMKVTYKRRLFEESLQYAISLVDIDPNRQSYRYCLRTLERLINEKKTAHFDMESLRMSLKIDKRIYIPCGDYLGPLKVVEIEGKGRGLVLTRSVKAQTLIMASTAIYSYFSHVAITAPHATFLAVGEFFQTPLMDYVLRNPNICDIIYDMCSGERSRKEVQAFCKPETRSESICHPSLIKDICVCNLIPILHKYESGGTKCLGWGLFRYPSYINHSCVPNIYAEFFHNVVFIYSKFALKAGQELLWNYLHEEFSPKEKRRRLAMRGFACLCVICQKEMVDLENEEESTESISDK